MTNPDCRAELQRLVEAYEEHGGKWPDHHEQALFQAVEDARAVLAQPEPEGVVTPTLPGGVPLTGGLSWLIPTLDDVVELCEEFGFELHEDNESGEILWEMFRAVLARWGTPTAQPEPEPVAPTDEELLAMRSWSSHGHTFDSDLVDFGRRCYNLAKQPVSTPFKLPEPVAPTVMEIIELHSWLDDEWQANNDGEDLPALDYARAVLARWGTPNPITEELK